MRSEITRLGWPILPLRTLYYMGGILARHTAASVVTALELNAFSKEIEELENNKQGGKGKLKENDNILSGVLANDTNALIAKIRPKIEENLERCYRDIHGNREYMFEVKATMAVKKPPVDLDICPKNQVGGGKHDYMTGPSYTCIYCGQDNPNQPKTGWDILTKQARDERDKALGERDKARTALIDTCAMLEASKKGWDPARQLAITEKKNAWEQTESARAERDAAIDERERANDERNAYQEDYESVNNQLGKLYKEIVETRATAEHQAWFALADGAFSRFGTWASVWHHMNRLSEDKADDPFSGLSNKASEKAAEHD